MRAWTRSAVVIAAAASTVVLTSCGPDPGAGLTVVAVDAAFDAAQWVVPAGEEVEVTVTNDGRAPHDWTVLKPGFDFTTEEDVVFALLDGVDFAVHRIAVAPGESVTETLVFDQPGTYSVICTIEEHIDLGMRGTLIVGG